MSTRSRTPSRWLRAAPDERTPLVALFPSGPARRHRLRDRRALALLRCLDLWAPGAVGPDAIAAARGLSAAEWRRPPDAWTGGEPPLASLADHLLRTVRYPLPAFLYALLGGADGDLAAAVLGHTGAGGPLRTAPRIPALTRREAHLVWTTAAADSVHAAVRRAQVLAAGGPEWLWQELRTTRYGRAAEDEALCARHVAFLARHAAGLEPARVGPLVDWLATQPTVPASLAGALREERAWHAAHAYVPRLLGGPLPRSGLRGARLEAEDVTIRELDTVEALVAEGVDLAHCVATYAGVVRSGRSSIWSVRRGGERRVTIEVWNADLAIVQVRGRANRRATAEEVAWIEAWASQEGLVVRER